MNEYAEKLAYAKKKDWKILQEERRQRNKNYCKCQGERLYFNITLIHFLE